MVASGKTSLKLVRAGSPAAADGVTTVGGRVREMRRAKGWSLAKLSTESGIPQSTLSKFETDNLSLPLDRIFRLGDALGLAVTHLFEPDALPELGEAPGRRSVVRAGEGRRVTTETYDRRWLFTDLIQKRMFPLLQDVLARDMAAFGPLLRHEGEEFSIVLKGRVQVVTDIYEPVILNEMDGIYIDSRMGHAYLNMHEATSTILNVSTVANQYPPAAESSPDPED